MCSNLLLIIFGMFCGLLLVSCQNPPADTTTVAPVIDENSRMSLRKCKEYSKAMYEYVKLKSNEEMVEIDRCGSKAESLILIGQYAKPREFPHMALVGFDRGNNEKSWSCSGTLISEQHVLTAAHCLNSATLGEPKYIRLGELNFSTEDDDADPEDFNITQIIPHPKFIRRLRYNDIAILVMDRKVKLTPYHRPACLPQSFDNPEKKVIATGWGYTDWAGEGSNDLLKVTLDKFDYQECNASYEKIVKLPNGIEEQTQFCAGSKNREKDMCQGDSGGPLQVSHSHLYCMYDVIGVSSFGLFCGSRVPGVYTRVYGYLDWIESVVWG